MAAAGVLGVEGSAMLPSPAPFPSGVFPAKIEEALNGAASAFTVPLAVPAMTFLAVLGASIGRTRGLEVKPGWVIHPNLYCALVARSGMGKSPCTNAILKPIHEREHTAFQEYQEALAMHDLKMREWQSAFTKAQRSNQELPDKPTLPHWSQIYVEDSTTQAVGAILQNNPRGVLWYRDELSGVLSDLGRYDSKGGDAGDKARLLSAYDCGAWKVSRSTKDGLHIPHACVSIFGTVQPGLLPALFKQRDAISGFLPRFLFIRCEQTDPPLWSTESFGGDQASLIHGYVDQALQLAFASEETPHIIELSPQASKYAISWYNNQVLAYWYQPALEQFEALAPKLRGVFFKLTLIMHILESWSQDQSELQAVALSTMQRTADLMEWIQEQQRQVWMLLSSGSAFEEVSTLERRVAKAVIELATQQTKSILPTSLIVAHLNKNLSEQFHVTSDAVGKTYRKLCIEVGRSSKARGAKLSPELLEHLKQYLPPENDVIGVIPVTDDVESPNDGGKNTVTPSVTSFSEVSQRVTQ